MADILIVGADQGIGYFLAESLLENGNRVAVLDIRTDHIAELQPKYGNSLLVIKADAADSLSVQEGVMQAFDCFGSIDIAIHNACLCTFDSEPDTDLEVYRQVMDVNFYGALRLAKAVLPHMREAGKGRLMVEMAKAHGLNVEKYLTFLLEKRPHKGMTDEELEKLTPWSEEARIYCGYAQQIACI